MNYAPSIKQQGYFTTFNGICQSFMQIFMQKLHQEAS